MWQSKKIYSQTIAVCLRNNQTEQKNKILFTEVAKEFVLRSARKKKFTDIFKVTEGHSQREENIYFPKGNFREIVTYR